MELAIINQKIYTVRSVKIMLDRDLAELYEVETRVLNQSVKRNKELFPSDFMFQLTNEEYENMSSQFVMTSKTKRPNSALPFAFTEHGVAMLSNVLKSIKARLISVEIVRAFIALKKFTLSNQELNINLSSIIKIGFRPLRNNELLITLLKMYRDTLRKGYEVNRCLSAENLIALHKNQFSIVVSS
ncbi:MAG: ORF6N domain-containing protein [Flavobacteriia bacterium]|nr:ORF6N domain-containing protein [Flavobacteriia bacterium]